MGAFCLLLPLYVACTIDQERLARPPAAAAPELEAPPPAAPSGEESVLYQELFTGESGADMRQWGQRARMLAWFRYMALDEEQLEGLTELSATLAERDERIRTAQADAARAEMEAMHGEYARAIELLAEPGDPDADVMSVLASDLAAARFDAGASALYRVRHTELRGMLTDTQVWIEDLDSDQQTALGSSRFLLRHQVGPLVAPGDHAQLLGTMWDGMAFDALVLGRLPTESEPLDIGGLWATEKVRGTPDQRLSAVQRRVLVLLAARQEGLVEAIEVALGEREPLDGLPAREADTRSP